MQRLVFALALILAACGGGGGGSSPVVTTSPVDERPLRTTPVYTCYFAGVATTQAAYADHTSCIEPGAWDQYLGQGSLNQLAAFAQNDTRGVVLMLPPTTCGLPLDQIESETTFYLKRIFDASKPKVIAVRPDDEPRRSDAVEKACLIAVHAAMAKFPETLAKPITMYYPCSESSRPGIEYVDWPGCDVYDWSFNQIAAVYVGYETSGEASRDVAMIIGGSFKQDPTPFAEYALHDERVKLVQGFCFDKCGGLDTSISTNGMLAVFREQFLRLKGI